MSPISVSQTARQHPVSIARGFTPPTPGTSSTIPPFPMPVVENGSGR